MAACANLGGKGQYGLAFLPRQPHRLVIGTICQADGPLYNVLFSVRFSPTWACGEVDLQHLSATIQGLNCGVPSKSCTFLYGWDHFSLVDLNDSNKKWIIFILCPHTPKVALLQNNPWTHTLVANTAQKSSHISEWRATSGENSNKVPLKYVKIQFIYFFWHGSSLYL